ncbi:MAG: carboxypeptidase regulatory-like domain-containing protein [Planctomycetes bacterium]|nr:carboxypeptidase regulatory-like domain-containing protein [Planctomycetota bacterium]
MNVRDVVVLTGLLAVLAAGAALLFGFGAEAAHVSALDEPRQEEPVESDEPAELPDAPVVVVGNDRIDTADDASSSSHATVGAIEGRVGITTSLLGEVECFHVRVQELVGASSSAAAHKPYDKIWPNAFVVPERSTPRFRLEGIPFSPYGYRVELIAEHCNGSSQVVRLNANEPEAQVSLTLSRPAMFTLRVQDQHYQAHTDWDFELRPLGAPAGRTTATGRTDRFGTALFDSLIQGTYIVVHENYEVGEVQVQPRVMPRSGHPIAVQSATIVVPVGRDLRIEIFGPAGVGLASTELELQKTDTIRNERFEGVTDVGGIYTFQFLAPGRYQLNVHAPGFERTSRSITIDEETAAEPLQVHLAPTR